MDGAVEAFGRLDVLVTNAGVLRDKSLLKMTDEDFDLVIQVHLRGTFTCAREAYRYFKDNGVPGRIITIGSPTGQYGNFGQTNYAAAKAGIVGMVRTWALEMKKAGVTANAVIPVAATAMTETIPFFRSAVEADRRGEPMPDFFRKDLGFGNAADEYAFVQVQGEGQLCGGQHDEADQSGEHGELGDGGECRQVVVFGQRDVADFIEPFRKMWDDRFNKLETVMKKYKRKS